MSLVVGRPIFCYRNKLDFGTLSGGSWQSTLPLANLQDRRPTKVARSASADADDTRFTLTLDSDQLIRVASVHHHNLSLAGRVRFRAYPALTATRALAAYYRGEDGVLRQAASGEVRHWHYTEDGVRVTLLEPTAVNLCLQSQNLGTTWSNDGTSENTNTDVAPDGTTTADRMIETGATSNHGMAQDVTKAASALPYVYSHHVKAGTRGWVTLQLQNSGGTGFVRVYFNLDTGAVGTTQESGTFTLDDYGVEYIDGEWWRPWVRATTDTDTTIRMVVRMHQANGTLSYAGDGSSYISLWGAQLEQKTALGGPSSYIPTTTVAVTRPDDVAYGALNDATMQAFTSYWKFVEGETPNFVSEGAANRRVWQIAGSTEPRFTVWKTPGAGTYQAHFGGVSDRTVTVVPSVTIEPGMTVELVSTIDEDGSVVLYCRVNGGAWTSSSVGSTNVGWSDENGGEWNANRIYLASQNDTTGQSYGGHILGRLNTGVMEPDEIIALEAGDLFEFNPYDSGLLNPYEVYPADALQAGHDAYPGAGLVGTLAEVDWDDGFRPQLVHVLPEPAKATYASFEFIDEANADGYVDVGRPWVSYGYRPSHNASVGVKLGWKDTGSRFVTDGDTAVFDERTRIRTASMDLDQFEDDEALAYLDELGRFCGVTRQLLLVIDEAAGPTMHRMAVLGTFDRLDPLNLGSRYHSKSFTMIEEL